jgi:hypothetical protein
MISLRVDVASLTEHPDKVSVLLAKAFFKELRRYNFSDRQVIRVASELIECLNKSLEGYKDKVSREGGGDDDRVDATE